MRGYSCQTSCQFILNSGLVFSFSRWLYCSVLLWMTHALHRSLVFVLIISNRHAQSSWCTIYPSVLKLSQKWQQPDTVPNQYGSMFLQSCSEHGTPPSKWIPVFNIQSVVFLESYSPRTHILVFIMISSEHSNGNLDSNLICQSPSGSSRGMYCTEPINQDNWQQTVVFTNFIMSSFFQIIVMFSHNYRHLIGLTVCFVSLLPPSSPVTLWWQRK